MNMKPFDADRPTPAIAGKCLLGGVHSQLFAAGLLITFGLLLYGQTLPFPFVFDDYIYLVNNPLLKNIHSFIWMGDFTKFANYSKALGLDPNLSTNFILRPFSYFTFYLNYILDGINPRGFRAVNITIHCANAIMLFLLIARVLRTARKSGTPASFSVNFIAFSTALLFLAHPLQIESVTYIVQRFTSLGTFFYLSTILTFLLANDARSRLTARGWRIASVTSLIIGMFSKEFLFTAPFMLILLDWLVMGSPLKRALRRTLPYFFCLPIIPVLILFTAWAQNGGGPSLSAAFNITNSAAYSQYHYGLTQLSVVLTYLRLVFFPWGLNLDWDYPLTTSVLQGAALVSVFVLVGILGGTWFWYRHHGQDVRHALLSYSVLWFFMTLAIDSSIVPLPDLLAEHRSYLPSLGMLCALACGMDLLRTELNNRYRFRYVIPVMMAIGIIALATATHARHRVWRSEISIWKDVLAKSPQKPRPWFNLGTAYYEQGQPYAAITCIRRTIALLPTSPVAYLNLGRVENSLGRNREALKALRMGVWLAPNDYGLHYELGVTYARLRDLKHSEIELQQAINLCPSYRPAHLALGALYADLKQYDKALEQVKLAAALQPLDPRQRQFADRIAGLAVQKPRPPPR